jgi:hypothetical protein
MKPIFLVLGASLVLAAASPSVAAAPAKSSAEAPKSAIDPAAVQALDRMSAYLRTLVNFEITADNSMELVLDSGQKIENDHVATYKVRRPDGFVIETASDQRVRQYVYNGKQLTVASPELGVYATVPAPPTIMQTLDAAAEKYGVVVPLEDLFLWGDKNNPRPRDTKSAVHVGTATIDGVKTDQYAFRGPKADWQIWIAQGAKPVPVKIVIIGLEDSAHPAFISRLKWKTDVTLDSSVFEFKPTKDAMAIKFASDSK